MSPWKSISGAVCLNIYMSGGFSEPEKFENLLMPVNCSLYFSYNWDKLNFSCTAELDELRKHVSADIKEMKEMLIQNPNFVMEGITPIMANLNGSQALCAFVIQALYRGNESIYDGNMKTLFQECWEVLFWYIQDKPVNVINTITNDFADDHIVFYEKVILQINDMNPI